MNDDPISLHAKFSDFARIVERHADQYWNERKAFSLRFDMIVATIIRDCEARRIGLASAGNAISGESLTAFVSEMTVATNPRGSFSPETTTRWLAWELLRLATACSPDIGARLSFVDQNPRIQVEMPKAMEDAAGICIQRWSNEAAKRFNAPVEQAIFDMGLDREQLHEWLDYGASQLTRARSSLLRNMLNRFPAGPDDRDFASVAPSEQCAAPAEDGDGRTPLPRVQAEQADLPAIDRSISTGPLSKRDWCVVFGVDDTRTVARLLAEHGGHAERNGHKARWYASAELLSSEQKETAESYVAKHQSKVARKRQKST